MDASLVASIAAARLALPIPTAKLLTAWEFAKALGTSEGRQVGWPALREWLATRKFESEILEGLVPVVISRCTSKEATELRKTIQRPSLAMDVMLAAATGQSTLLPSWQGCHSGPAPKFAELSTEEALLASGRILPGLFSTEFEELQDRSGKPFLRQWAYEYQTLEATRGFPQSERFDYFANGEQGASGMVVSQRSHAARSAFLRTLAYASEYWSMPLNLAHDVATAAFPGETTLLRMAPGLPPECAGKLYGAVDGNELSAENIASRVLDALCSDPLSFPMHFSGCVYDSPMLTIDVSAFAIPVVVGYEANIWVHWYQRMLGNVQLERNSSFALVISALQDRRLAGDPSIVAPLLAPILPKRVGYFHADLIQRPPYLPAWVPGDHPILAYPREGGMALEMNGKLVGTMRHWMANWNPLVLRDAPAGTASSTHINAELVGLYENVMERKVGHACAVTIRRRTKTYGDWSSETSECIVEPG
ncbi:hypothetical protein ACEN8I_05250 [Polaromonas sp. CT11-55]|uniref:hypothetical protein n=1 Tax=Polaromonas sp. CT11-55 TaxID=3243045 RepID=UPI0039A60D6E